MANKTSLETSVTEKSHSTGSKVAHNIALISAISDPTLYVKKTKKGKTKKTNK